MSSDETRRSGERSDDELFAEFVQTRSRTVRNTLVERHMGLATHIAQRYARPGNRDDLRQVAMIGLVKAIDRFDPSKGVSLTSFAGLTIEGELKRHFRDTGWTVRVPRSAQELHLAVRNATDELGHRLGRAPTVDETAAHLGVDRDDVLRGLAASAASTVGSLDSGRGHDDDAVSDRQAALATAERGFDDVIDEQLVEALLSELPEREQEILRLRFHDELSQSQIAERMGMSQMHVSRLLRRSFEQMRSALEDATDEV